jgi:hypothetical protein
LENTGRVVKAEDFGFEIFESPTEATIIQAPFIWIKRLDQKDTLECSNPPGIVACAVIPQMGG